METVQIQLPLALVQQIQQEIPSDKALSQVIAEAIQMWLERQREGERRDALRTLRQAGMVMNSERQRALAEAVMVPLPLKEAPTRAQVEALLAKLKVPLSEEIITMRSEEIISRVSGGVKGKILR